MMTVADKAKAHALLMEARADISACMKLLDDPAGFAAKQYLIKRKLEGAGIALGIR
jgi:hypothetical protein